MSDWQQASAKLLYAGTFRGVQIFEATPSATWQTVASALQEYDISALAWDERNRSVVLAGTADGLLFRSADFGATWQQIADFEGRKVWSIAPDYNRPVNNLYVGVSGGYLFFSSDGETFRELTGLREFPTAAQWWGPFGPAIFHSVLPVLGEPGKIYLGLSVVGVLLSEDEGRTWRDATANLPRMSEDDDSSLALSDVHKLLLHPRQPNRLYVTTHLGTYRSDDGSQSWQDISAGLPFRMTRPLALHPTDPSVVFVIAHEDAPDNQFPIIKGALTVHRSRDAGQTWQPLNTGLPKEANCSILREAFTATQQQPYSLYLGTNKGQLFASNDEGDSWQQIAELGCSVRVLRAF